MRHAIVHTDGSIAVNPGKPGSWAFVIQVEGQCIERSGRCDEITTSNRMELTAALEALNFLGEPCSVDLYTDSQYLRNGAVLWIRNWVKKNFKKPLHTSVGFCGFKPIPNADLWREIARHIEFHRIKWHWIRGHADNEMNCRCDKLAEEARKAL